jgi:putative AbiEii toxin of type IV toxin-antitoxin system
MIMVGQDENTGVPHLQVKFEHWRGIPSNQREDQFSDGTLRLIGMLWSLFTGDSLLLLEEPELSLNTGKRRVGPDYNGRLAGFIQTSWRPEIAQQRSKSLLRIWNVLNAFTPIYTSQ